MSTNAQSSVADPEPVVLYNKALLLCAADGDVRNECAFMFETINNDTIPDSPLIFEPNFYQMRKDVSGNFLATNTPQPFANDLGGDVRMVQIFYENVPKDQPEYVDINNLTSFEDVANKTPSKGSIVISDDESDVIFVKEYKKEEQAIERNEGKEDGGVRRNPVRKARTNRGRGHLQNEHLLEEDFDFLDHFDEDNVVICKTKSPLSSTSNESGAKQHQALKEWPINAFERPEYDPQTDKIEPFDYTIRDLRHKQLRKKPRLETCTKPKRKPKKKYIIRKRKPKSKKPVEKTPIDELKGVVAATFEMITDFLKTTQCDKKNQRRIGVPTDTDADGLYDLLKNQIALMAIINNYGEREITQSVSKLLSEN